LALQQAIHSHASSSQREPICTTIVLSSSIRKADTLFYNRKDVLN
jgi:hypothetical protein